MADAVVSYAVEKLGDYLINKAVFLKGVRSEVKWLKNELEWMQCFIKDADERANDDPKIRKWVSDIRDLAEDARTVLDTFILKVDDKAAPGGRSGGLLGSFLKCSCIIDKGKEQIDLYDIGNEIEKLKQRIEDLNRKCTTYGLQTIDGKRQTKAHAKLKDIRRQPSRKAGEKLVGLEDATQELQARLLEHEPCRFIISIVGMGGLGKTTLARKLYNDNHIQQNFDFHGWVCVSEEYETRDLLIKIIKSFDFKEITAKELKMMEIEDLERYLYTSLQGRSYLVVVDDVWEKEAWKSLKKAFPDDGSGSRVIITTRKMDVAARSDDKTHIHRLRLLTEKESWELFSNKAFVKKRDDILEKLGREMMQKCCGLPLAIIVLSGLLSQKHPNEWREVRNNIFRHLENDSTLEINSLLDLSFDDLPRQLKSVFLYLSLFPEDSEIDVGKLIRLLVAEDLVTQDEDRVMEEVATQNLNELCDRSLVQKGEKSWGTNFVTCRLHDLIRDLAIKKAREQCFSSNCDTDKDFPKSSIVSKCKRYAIYSGSEMGLWLPKYCNEESRTLLFFCSRRDDVPNINELLLPICKKFTLLKVLDLKGFNFGKFGLQSPNYLPTEIGELVHLKYLGLRNTFIKTLPSSIANFQRLQTLDVMNDVFVELPTEISELEKLRHLIGFFNGPLLLNNLTNLQTLDRIEYRWWMKLEHKKFANLRELWVSDENYESNIRSYSFESFGKLKRIQSLHFKWVRDCYTLCLQPLVNCLDLINLSLCGEIEKLPEDLHTILPNLECLTLDLPKFQNDPMPILEKLPNLIDLALFNDAYYKGKMVCKAKGFSRLEVLALYLYSLKEWEVEDGAMPVLQKLKTFSPLKSIIPRRFQSITSFVVLNYSGKARARASRSLQ